MSAQAFDEGQHPREQSGRFAAWPAPDAVGGLDALQETQAPDTSDRNKELAQARPLDAVGPEYRQWMLELVAPADRADVAEGDFELYFALRRMGNPYTHEDALVTANGHAELSTEAPSRKALLAMDDDEFRKHQLVWDMRRDRQANRRIANASVERQTPPTPRS